MTNLLKTFLSESDSVRKWCFYQKATVSSKYYIGNVEVSFENLPQAFSSNSDTIHIILKGQKVFFPTEIFPGLGECTSDRLV